MDLSNLPLNDIAGLAALVNSLILWPVIRSFRASVDALKTIAVDHGGRLERLERTTRSRAKRRARK